MKKNIFKILTGVLVLVIALTGCSVTNKIKKSGAEKSTYTLKDPTGDIKLTYTHKNDEILEETVKYDMIYTERGTTKDQMKNDFKSYTKETEDIKGFEHSIKYEEKKAVETIKVDFSKVDIEKLREVPGFVLVEDIKDNKVSMKKTDKLLKKEGYNKEK